MQPNPKMPTVGTRGSLNKRGLFAAQQFLIIFFTFVLKLQKQELEGAVAHTEEWRIRLLISFPKVCPNYNIEHFLEWECPSWGYIKLSALYTQNNKRF